MIINSQGNEEIKMIINEGIIKNYLLEAFTKNKLFPHMLKTPLWDHLHACANYNQVVNIN